jgi:hypothetical protein
MESNVKNIVSQIHPTKGNFMGDIPSDMQDEVIAMASIKIKNFDDGRNRFFVPLDAKEVVKVSINIEQALYHMPKGITKVDYSPTNDEIRCLNMRKEMDLENLSAEELVNLKTAIFDIERTGGKTNFWDAKKDLFNNYLIHHLFVRAASQNARLLTDGSDEIFKYYENFLQQNIDVEKLLISLYPNIYDLDNLFERIRNSGKCDAYTSF